MVNSNFLQDLVQGACFFGSSGVFPPFKGCSNGLHLLRMKLPFAPLVSLWAESIICDSQQITPDDSWALQQTDFP
jgi:hypothetical protein